MSLTLSNMNLWRWLRRDCSINIQCSIQNSGYSAGDPLCALDDGVTSCNREECHVSHCWGLDRHFNGVPIVHRSKIEPPKLSVEQACALDGPGDLFCKFRRIKTCPTSILINEGRPHHQHTELNTGPCALISKYRRDKYKRTKTCLVLHESGNAAHFV